MINGIDMLRIGYYSANPWNRSSFGIMINNETIEGRLHNG